MKPHKVPSDALATLSIALPGVIGLSVVTRALFVYLGHDPLASLIVLCMGAGLTAGLVELFVRKRRALALSSEVAKLPSSASESAIEGASPALRAFLRARIEHAPTPASPESITGYLVGLMVMLGLLGTLLGLFETLNGAGRALTESGNIDALRNGLSGPMRGLTRSFGCSAAGVSASAMLGLAAVLVRRLEARALSAVQAYATGPLRELSPVRRQLNVLDKLANQGDSLPRAADALSLLADRIGGLAERWEEAHRTATEAQRQSLQSAFQELRDELTRGAVSAGRTLTEAVGPLVKQMVAETGETASKHMSATLSALQKDQDARRAADTELRTALRAELQGLRGGVEQDLKVRSEESARTFSTLQASMRELASEQVNLLAAQREQASEHVRAVSEESARALSTLQESMQRHAGEQANLLAAQREQASEHVRTIADVASGLSRTLADSRADDHARHAEQREEIARQNAVLAERWQTLAAEVAESARATRAEEEARLTRLDGLTQRFGADLGQLAGAMAEQLGARLERERMQSERSEQAMNTLSTSGRALEDALARQELAVQALLEGASEQLAKMGTFAQEGAREAVAKLVSVTDEQAARFAQLEQQLEASQAALSKGLAEELANQATRLGQGLEGTTQLVHEAAAVLKASSVEMGAVAEMFAKGVERQREAAQAWMESLGELEGAVERAGRGAAADALGDQLASTQEVFARQLQFQRELFEQLRSLRVGPVPSARGEQDASA